jgi:hypothetical protein
MRRQMNECLGVHSGRIQRDADTHPFPQSKWDQVPRREEIAMKRAILAAALLLGSTAIASAHDWRGYSASDIDARRANQMRRIEEGRRSGQLNWREYRYLKREQAHIAADERRAKADGHLSLSERRRLNRELDQAGRDIRRLKHNEQVAGSRRWNRWN